MEKGIITMLDHRENFDKGIEALRELGIETIWENKIIRSSRDPKVVIEQVKGYDYVFAGGEIWNKEVFNACPTVKMIVRLGVGYDGINLADASAAGVPVTYMPGVNAKSVAEHAVALMLAACRQIPQMNALIHDGRRKEAIYATNTVSGKTVGILGCGNIGKSVAKMLYGFDCKLLAYDVYQDADFAEKYGVTYVDQETLIRKSDIISVHLPLIAETKHAINADSIAKMKDGVVIVNTSRGGTVDSAALAAALRSGKVGAAGLDVAEDEGGGNPRPGEIFYGINNAILTPHVAGATHECFEEMMDIAVEMVKDFKNGKEPKWLLNPDYRR
ncbi:MAG: phosphoglycerate dehydrogenase [Christensenellaceae bacterium]|nr:phosphoglycerate dehydrogenase [Christensenellaceae bacterium]